MRHHCLDAITIFAIGVAKEHEMEIFEITTSTTSASFDLLFQLISSSTFMKNAIQIQYMLLLH